MMRSSARVLSNIARVRALLVLAGSLTIAAVASAQTSGVISGTVTDEDNRPLPGVTITLASPANEQLRRSVITNVSGRYEIADLPAGTYTVTAELPAFVTAVKTQPVTGDRREVWLVMEPGALEEILPRPKQALPRIIPVAATRIERRPETRKAGNPRGKPASRCDLVGRGDWI